MTSTREDPAPPRTGRWRRWGIAGSAVLCVAIALCYGMQPDWLAAVTLVPPWCWAIAGVVLAIGGYGRERRLRLFSVLALWGLFVVVFVEEPRSLVRIGRGPTAVWQAARERGRGVRVVSLNCGAGQARSAEEVAVWKPDVVLLQESPGREEVVRLSQTLFGAEGAFLYGGDVSIVARGRIEPKLSSRASHFVHAEVELPSGLTTDVVSVRLAPPVFRLDFWMPGFWIDHRNKRMEHREQILEMMKTVQTIPASGRLIVGGDFNAPPYDDALAPLRRRLFDTFRQAGRGWGATGTNGYPLFRVDQVWASPSFRAEAVTTQKTRHSDHRMVVCDLILEE